MAWYIRLAFAGLTAGILVHGAVRGDSAMYVGGTTVMEQNTNGRIQTSDAAQMFFNSKKGTLKSPRARWGELDRLIVRLPPNLDALKDFDERC